jgi:cation diffusion facilitator CzcD-associated flavoprotein CzcO
VVASVAVLADRRFEIVHIVRPKRLRAVGTLLSDRYIRGVGAEWLKDRWRHGPETYLGVMVDGFPNVMMVIGPHIALGSIPRSTEHNVDWVTDLVRHLRDN